ncbi:hypothetical protein SanaruYs_06100 [Chryseotalea sanaruensis]|uniref:DUF8173 domain-containing protein n=1 Tax=Chryseotalea sanaruensis TaxID=2482724 RepID=A0A401U684_9BACT|nr:hypothetical protein [Chryseotalea sanaruensis]GCC50395.1 hypothetical protein SanaruYs_06100 [Chryseotalea sanaruensis]
MKFIGLILLSAFILINQKLTAQIRSGENVLINKEVAHDLYVAGGTVTINAPIRGDLIIAGGTVIVNDTVTQDILIGGGNITLNGYVADDVRCAGGTVQLSGVVSGDYVVSGGEINILSGGIIAGNMFSIGGKVILDGAVKGSVKNASGAFDLNGTVAQGLDSKGGKIKINGIIGGTTVMAAETIEIGASAKFKDTVRYWNQAGSLDFGNSLNASTASYDPSLEIEGTDWYYLGFASLVMVLWYLGAALIMLIIIQYLFRLTFMNAVNTIKNNSIKSLGAGFLFLFGVPVAIVIGFLTLIGIPLGLLTFFIYLTILLHATVITALLIANWINNTYYKSSWQNIKIVGAAFAIFIFLKLASFTPFIGPLIMLLLACMGFGGLLLNIKWKSNKALAVT